jgi:nitrate reductase NapE
LRKRRGRIVLEGLTVKNPDEVPASRQRRMEIAALIFVTVIFMPALTVAIVGGYGFSVWVYQMVAGPPGPPT